MPKKIDDGLTRSQRYIQNHPERKEYFKEVGRIWRQTDKGKFIRNRNHWIAGGISEPPESWEVFWETFKLKTNCYVCDIQFNLQDGARSKQARCLDHHHRSGAIRNVICRSCNLSTMRHFDRKHDAVLFELHRYFVRNEKIFI
tara:strand:+ start:202 stop:630 length:429 start_codon:yes stop_codon:yes gene_type:complete